MKLFLFLLIMFASFAEASVESCLGAFRSLYHYNDLKAGSLQLDKVHELSDLERFYSPYGLNYTEYLISFSIGKKAYNEKVSSLLARELSSPLTPLERPKKNYLTEEALEQIFQSRRFLPQLEHFMEDFRRGIQGFCYGRALVYHAELLLAEVLPDAIKKIWWAFYNDEDEIMNYSMHVATMVRGLGRDGNLKWFVLDTLTGLQVVDDWMDFFLKQKSVPFFVTQAGRFSSSSPETYSKWSVFSKAYQGYFIQFFEDLERVFQREGLWDMRI